MDEKDEVLKELKDWEEYYRRLAVKTGKAKYRLEHEYYGRLIFVHRNELGHFKDSTETVSKFVKEISKLGVNAQELKKVTGRFGETLNKKTVSLHIETLKGSDCLEIAPGSKIDLITKENKILTVRNAGKYRQVELSRQDIEILETELKKQKFKDPIIRHGVVATLS